MTNFIHHEFPKLEQINSPNGRRYRTPEGNLYPSVTTVLSAAPNEHLQKWKERVGESEADRISKAAAKRGTIIHMACENYLLGGDFQFSPFAHESRDMYRNIEKYLKRFTDIHALETRMYSDKLRVAGTVDCIASIDGVPYIIDFKTSGRYKCREEIDSYFMQGAAYSAMFWERTGILIPNIRIFITTQDDGVLDYIEPVIKWIPKFVALRALVE